MGAGGAGGRNGQVRALGAVGHCDNAGCRIERNGGNKVRMDAVGFVLLVELGDLTLAHDHPAHAGSHDDSDAVRVLLRHLKSRVSQCFFRSHETKLGVAVHAFTLD
ncbi:MAG: hypothetical protein JW395_3410 [Nitrospira sp.]|nr:hypothetical protein [Nitrospira sp.]